MPVRLAHLSDVHVPLELRAVPVQRIGWRRTVARLELEVRGRARWFEDAEATLRELAAEAFAQADHVILTGDATTLSTPSEFERAVEALGPEARDPRRFSIIPGNHDRYTAASVRSRRFERFFEPVLVSDLPAYAVDGGYPYIRFVGSGLAVIGLDSTRLAPLPGLAWGRVRSAQLAALDALLDDRALSGRAVAVMVHHAPFRANGRPDSFIHGLHGAARLLEVLRGRATALFHGHLHERYHHEGGPGRVPIFCAGSSTIAGGEGGWLVEFDGPALVRARPLTLPPKFSTKTGGTMAAR